MKNFVFVLSLFISTPIFAQKAPERWETYLAQYGDSIGSTVVDLSLKELVPVAQYPILVQVMVKVNQCRSDGLPVESEREWKNLHTISDELKAVIANKRKFSFPGTFTYQCWRTDYYYVQDTNGLRNELLAKAKKYQTERDFKIVIKPDRGWECYLSFLYPNDETMEYITNERVLKAISNAGDKLTKPRQIDHWLYFSTEADRDKFVSYAIAQQYKLESKEFSNKTDLHYQLHLSRIDNIEIGSISKITLELRRKAKEYNGNYDGWEALVVKE